MHLPSLVRILTRSYTPAWAVLVVGVALSLYVSARLRRQSEAANLARFARAVDQTRNAIRDRLQKYEMAAASLADYVGARDSLTPPEWRFRLQMVANEETYPGLLEAGFAELVSATTNTALPPSVETPAPANPSAGASFRVVYGWARPPSAMSGVDPQFLAEPDQLESAWKAIATASTTLSDVRLLSSEVNGQPAQGVSIFAPLYHRATAASTNQAVTPAVQSREDSARRARGVSFVAIQPELMLDALFGLAPREISFELFSRPIVTKSLWLNPAGKQPRALDPAFRPYLRTNFALPMANQTWSLHCYTTPLFEREASLSRPWVVLPLGLGLTAALSGLMAIQIRAHIRQRAVAAELRSAYDDLHQAQSERERVSRELHDGAIQSLYLLQLTLGRCERFLTSNSAKAREVLAQSRSGINDLIAELRRFLLRDEVHPQEAVSFEQARAALLRLVQRFRTTESLAIQVAGNSASPVCLTSVQLQHLSQIAQEAMSNTLRHAQARTMSLDFSAADTTVHLTLADDGRGFDPQTRAEPGNGLANMQARAAQLGGTLRIESRPGRGTRITLEFPVAAPTELPHEQATSNQTADR